MYGAFCILEIGDIMKNISTLVVVILAFIMCALLVHKVWTSMLEYRKSTDKVQKRLIICLILVYLFFCFYIGLDVVNLLNS
nr:MAG TPA: hypothetical protein [Caudoviricetes sp.]